MRDGFEKDDEMVYLLCVCVYKDCFFTTKVIQTHAKLHRALLFFLKIELLWEFADLIFLL